MATLSYADAAAFRAEIDRISKPGDHIMFIPGKGLCVGESPLDPRAVFDFSQERFVDVRNGSISAVQTSSAAPATSARRTGAFEVMIKGKTLTSTSLKALLIDFLKEIEALCPGTWDVLSNVKARTRRIVARNKEELFDSLHLAEDFAFELAPGWFTNTNNSKQQVVRWLEEATIAAGLVWGRDVKARL